MYKTFMYDWEKLNRALLFTMFLRYLPCFYVIYHVFTLFTMFLRYLPCFLCYYCICLKNFKCVLMFMVEQNIICKTFNLVIIRVNFSCVEIKSRKLWSSWFQERLNSQRVIV